MNRTNSDQQSVTVTLPAALLRQVRHLAVDRGVSLSRFIALLLESGVESYRRYEAARERQLALMKEGLPLRTEGKTEWDRDDLHEH